MYTRAKAGLPPYEGGENQKRMMDERYNIMKAEAAEKRRKKKREWEQITVTISAQKINGTQTDYESVASKVKVFPRGTPYHVIEAKVRKALYGIAIEIGE